MLASSSISTSIGVVATSGVPIEPLMQERLVGQIEQVVHEEVKGSVDFSNARHGRPLCNVGQPRRFGKSCQVGLTASHPDPHEVSLFYNWIGANVRPCGYSILAWYGNARARTVKSEAVIPADQLLAFDRTQRERIAAVRTSIGERYDLTGLAAKERNVFAQNLAR